MRIQGWLNRQVGRGYNFIASETDPGIPDAAPFYIEDVEIARAFAQRFACSIVLLLAWTSDRPL